MVKKIKKQLEPMKKYAMITGSADRIGKAIAQELASQDINLVLHYNSSVEKVQVLKAELEKHHSIEVDLLGINFMSENDYDHIFQSLKERNITLDLLVNSASDFRPSGFEDVGSSMLQKEMRINFESIYLLTKAFARVYKKGEIINFLDTKVEKNFTKHLDYLLSKKLLKEFTKLSAVQLAPHFRVNAIAPGLILPPKDKDEAYLLELAKDIPLQRIGNITEIIHAFRFLLNAKFVTGQILYIDGGDHLI